MISVASIIHSEVVSVSFTANCSRARVARVRVIYTLRQCAWQATTKKTNTLIRTVNVEPNQISRALVIQLFVEEKSVNQNIVVMSCDVHYC